MTGPRSEPPMPMETTSVIFLPVTPVQEPERTCSAKAYMRSSTSCTSATASWPSTMSEPASEAGRRSAVWRPARSSVVLMWTPENIWSRLASRPTALPRATSSLMVSSFTRFFERSKWRSDVSNESFLTRCGSFANHDLSPTPELLMRSKWSCSARHSGVWVASIGAVTSAMLLLLHAPASPAQRVRSRVDRSQNSPLDILPRHAPLMDTARKTAGRMS